LKETAAANNSMMVAERESRTDVLIFLDLESWTLLEGKI
jgi:hypothetical protein